MLAYAVQTTMMGRDDMDDQGDHNGSLHLQQSVAYQQTSRICRTTVIFMAPLPNNEMNDIPMSYNTASAK